MSDTNIKTARKHTPWEASVSMTMPGFYEVVDARGTLIAETPSMELGRLLAAAPDLLAALKAGLSFVSHAADVQDWCGCDDCRTEWTLLQQQFKATIDKAEAVRP